MEDTLAGDDIPRRTRMIRRPQRVPWDWSDLALALLAYFGLAALIAVVVVGLAPACGLSSTGHCTGSEATHWQWIQAASVGAGEAAFLVVLAFGVGRRHADLAHFGWRPPSWKWLLAVIPIAVITDLATIPLGALNTRLVNTDLQMQTTQQCNDVHSIFGDNWWLAVLLVCVLPPICEETAFRGFLFGWMRRVTPWPVAVVLSAVVFSSAHMIPVIILPLMFVGMVLALCYEFSGSLYVGMLVHGTFNLINLVQILQTSTCS